MADATAGETLNTDHSPSWCLLSLRSPAGSSLGWAHGCLCAMWSWVLGALGGCRVPGGLSLGLPAPWDQGVLLLPPTPTINNNQ